MHWIIVDAKQKNPDSLELIRGKSGRIFGCLIAVLTILKGLLMTYNKDLQEGKKNIFEAFDVIEEVAGIVCELVPSINVRIERMASAVEDSYSYATHIVDYLVKKGVFFRDAHAIVSKLVNRCVHSGKYFQDLTIDEFKEFCTLFESDVFDLFKPQAKH